MKICQCENKKHLAKKYQAKNITAKTINLPANSIGWLNKNNCQILAKSHQCQQFCFSVKCREYDNDLLKNDVLAVCI